MIYDFIHIAGITKKLQNPVRADLNERLNINLLFVLQPELLSDRINRIKIIRILKSFWILKLRLVSGTCIKELISYSRSS